MSNKTTFIELSDKIVSFHDYVSKRLTFSKSGFFGSAVGTKRSKYKKGLLKYKKDLDELKKQVISLIQKGRSTITQEHYTDLKEKYNTIYSDIKELCKTTSNPKGLFSKNNCLEELIEYETIPDEIPISSSSRSLTPSDNASRINTAAEQSQMFRRKPQAKEESNGWWPWSRRGGKNTFKRSRKQRRNTRKNIY